MGIGGRKCSDKALTGTHGHKATQEDQAVNSDKLLTPREAAEYLRLNPRTVVRLARAGRIPALKMGNRWRFKSVALAQHLEREGAVPQAVPIAFPAQSKHLIASLMRPDLVICDLEASGRDEALERMVGCLAQAGYLARSAEFLSALKEREDLMNTGILPGIAFPHARRAIPGMFAKSLVLVAISVSGVDFQASGGAATHIFFVICASDDRSHLQILARLSRLFRDALLPRRIMGAGSPDEVIDAVASAEHSLPDDSGMEGRRTDI